MNNEEIIKKAIEYIQKHNQQIKIGNEYIDMVNTIQLLKILEGIYE